MLKSEVVCVECGRNFDLMIAEDAADWYYGHDCETNNED